MAWFNIRTDGYNSTTRYCGIYLFDHGMITHKCHGAGYIIKFYDGFDMVHNFLDDVV